MGQFGPEWLYLPYPPVLRSNLVFQYYSIKMVHTDLRLECRCSYLPLSQTQPVKSVLARNPGSLDQLVYLDLRWNFLKLALCRTAQRSLHKDTHSFLSCSSVNEDMRKVAVSRDQDRLDYFVSLAVLESSCYNNRY